MIAKFKYTSWLTRIVVFTCFLASSASAVDALRIGVQGEFHVGHPLLQNSEMSGVANSFSLLPIVSLEKTWTWKCRLCVKLPTQANRGVELFTDKVGLTKIAIHLEIPENAKWGDGEPITVKDFSFTWQLMQKVPVNARTSPALLEIEDVVVRPKEERHFTIILRSVSDPYPVLNSFFALSQHLEQGVFDKEKANYFANSLYVREYTRAGLYSGPYIPQSMSDTTLTMKRNTSSYVVPKIENITVQFFDSLRSLGSAVQNGIVDVVSGIPVWDETLNLLEALEKSGKTFKIVRDDSYYFEHLDFNLQNPLFQDTNVRRALAYAVDKEVILQQLKEWAIPAVSPVHPGDRYFSEKIAFYEFSPQKARKLLAQSDWTPGADGIRTKRTRALAFEIQTIDDPLRLKIARYLVEAWKNVGAQVTVKALPLNEFREKLARRHFSGAALYSWNLNPLKNKRTLFHSSAIPSLSNQYSGQNLSGWINAKVDESLTKVRVTLNENDRKNLFGIFQQEYTSELPGIPLAFRTNLSLTPHELKAFVSPPINEEMGLSVASWE